MAEALASDLAQDTDKLPHNLLGHREYQVLCRIGCGDTLRQIAQDLGLSPKTVSTYRTRLLEKMNMKSNAELTYYAIKHGLVDIIDR